MMTASTPMGGEDAFCQGMGRVMMPGFTWSFSPSERVASNSCILFLFSDALVNTAGKYAAAVIGTFFLSVAFEMLRAGRVRFVKAQAPFQRFKESAGNVSPVWLDCINASSYLVQVTIAYWLMLLVMIYEAMIFIAIVLGLSTGYFLVLQGTRRLDATKEGSAQDDASDMTITKEDKNDVDSEEAVDATHTAISPCCNNA